MSSDGLRLGFHVCYTYDQRAILAFSNAGQFFLIIAGGRMLVLMLR